MTALARTPDEIKAKLNDPGATDFFGVITERLVFALPYEDAKEYLVDSVTQEDFEAESTHTKEAVTVAADGYLDFAVGKMLDERGISANRSVDHYHGLIFLAFDDQTLQDFDDTPYFAYGRPQLEKAAELFGITERFNELVGER